MNNQQRPAGEQFILILLLTFAAMMIWQHFAPSNNVVKGRPDKAALPLAQAFAGIDAKQGALMPREQALQESASLTAEIKASGTDAYSYWARLRNGLLQQYIINPDHPETAVAGYDEVKNHNAQDDIEAQAVYQEGDLLWRQSTANGGVASKTAGTTLELLIHQGRGPSPLSDKQIYVPSSDTPAGGPPPQGFDLQPVNGISGANNVLVRVNEYYRPTTFFIVFNKIVRFCGNNPAYSYGLAIILFAICTRVVMQPLNKKQYESMKGMALIAPQMKKIQDRYKDKKDQPSQMQMMKEIRELQATHGVNPMLGCGLALLQMPIFFLVVSPLIQHNTAQMEIVHARFLWIHSLAGPDIPLLVLYAISMFVSFRLSATPPTDDMQRQQQMIMSFVMPFLFPFFLKNYPSAFTMYWMTFNLVSTALQWRMMKSADPSKDLVKSLFSNPGAMIEDLANKTIPKDVGSGTKGSDGTGGSKKTGKPGPVDKNPPDSRKGAIPPRPGKNGSNGSTPAFNGTAEPDEDGEDESEEVAGNNGDRGKGDGRTQAGSTQRARRRRRY